MSLYEYTRMGSRACQIRQGARVDLPHKTNRTEEFQVLDLVLWVCWDRSALKGLYY